MAPSLAPGARLTERLGALQTRLVADGLDALLVTHGANVFYLSNFKGSAGMLLVTPERASLIVDARYTTAVRTLLDTEAGCAGMAVEPVESSYEETACTVLRTTGVTRVGIESEHMTVARYDWLERALAGSDIVLRGTTGVVEAARLVKDPHELATLREAGARISGVMEQALRGLRVGRTEREVAADIDWTIRGAGFEGPAFETIVAAGPNTALPHAHPGERRLEHGDLVLLDFGGIYNGYCVDLTRVASLGRRDPVTVVWHAAVSAAHAAALSAVRPGVSASAVDTAARAVLEQRGLGAAFGHGTGHGLGIEVHEAPRVGKRRRAVGSAGTPGTGDVVEDVRLDPGMVFTVEPGVYLPGRGGVRLEDDLVVTPDGCELLTTRAAGPDRGLMTEVTPGPMDFAEINQILELMREHGLVEFELERDDLHVRLRKAETPTVPPPDAVPAVPAGVSSASVSTAPASGGTADANVTVVEAPILGTFYRAGAPDAPPFVEVGDVVKPGDVLCIIEAMKLMNDIKSEYAGEVVDIFVDNGQPVQYGERLFAIRRV